MADIYKLIAAYKKPNAAKNLKQFARFVYEYNDDSEKTIDKFVKKFSRLFKRFEKVLKRKEKVLAKKGLLLQIYDELDKLIVQRPYVQNFIFFLCRNQCNLENNKMYANIFKDIFTRNAKTNMFMQRGSLTGRSQSLQQHRRKIDQRLRSLTTILKKDIKEEFHIQTISQEMKEDLLERDNSTMLLLKHRQLPKKILDVLDCLEVVDDELEKTKELLELMETEDIVKRYPWTFQRHMFDYDYVNELTKKFEEIKI